MGAAGQPLASLPCARLPRPSAREALLALRRGGFCRDAERAAAPGGAGPAPVHRRPRSVRRRAIARPAPLPRVAWPAARVRLRRRVPLRRGTVAGSRAGDAPLERGRAARSGRAAVGASRAVGADALDAARRGAARALAGGGARRDPHPRKGRRCRLRPAARRERVGALRRGHEGLARPRAARAALPAGGHLAAAAARSVGRRRVGRLVRRRVWRLV
mmetsp:Transcript_3542/g.10396  ORF Transcript_3542/g.10396 Transcript_3542/m.10396 type:complete len:217 (+) Transcript_3542:2084-2734(+)